VSNHAFEANTAPNLVPSVAFAPGTAKIEDLDLVVREVVVKALNLEIGALDIADEANLFDLGADSMSIVDLFFQLEERFDVKFEEAQLSPEMFKRFADLAAFVRTQVAV
jgi:acyl carrier protein